MKPVGAVAGTRMSLTVSTKCPSCGGAVEFEEGSNAVRCGYCGSDHLVTGRGRVLSYYVPEKVPVREALDLAQAALAGIGRRTAKAREAALFFVPFFHYTGQALQWEARDDEERRRKEAEGLFQETSVADLISAITGGSAVRLYQRVFEARSRYMDRSLPALDIPELKVPSLGIRPEALKLSLFEHDAVSARGRIVPVRSSVDEKESFGYAQVYGEDVVTRAVFGKVRSVIYFPFWLVESAGSGGGGAGFSVVDAVSGEVTNPLAPASIIDKLVAKDGMKFSVAGLRPLKCPNCANRLAVRPRDVVFICGTCRKAWMVDGDGFTGVPCSVAAPVNRGEGAPLHLPFWVVRARLRTPGMAIENKHDLERFVPGVRPPREEDKGVPFRFFVPAFWIGNLMALSRLASNFTRFQPGWERDDSLALNPMGCYMSPGDALTIAPLIIFSLAPKANINKVRFALEANVEPLGTDLVLFPFYKGRGDYVDSILGQAVQLLP